MKEEITKSEKELVEYRGCFTYGTEHETEKDFSRTMLHEILQPAKITPFEDRLPGMCFAT